MNLHGNIKKGDPASILFAIEKQGSKQLISTDLDLITDNSRALSLKQGQPVKLKKYLNQLAAAFRRPKTGPNLPQSIKGLWKADLFLGSPARRGGAHFASSRSGGCVRREARLFAWRGTRTHSAFRAAAAA